ncbi:MAG: hypothetical protein EOP09_18925, partial [Proteobacteria bacterium]
MKKLLVILVLALTAQAQADVYGYEQYMPTMLSSYLSSVAGAAPFRDRGGCEPMYNPMLKDGVLDIVYAFGYMDDSTGVERVEGGINYGYGPSLDIAAFKAMRATLVSGCAGRAPRLCGFSESGSVSSGKVVFQKRMKLNDLKIVVRITMTQASASESLIKNKGELAGRQKALTEQSESNFFNGLRSADIVIYNG